MSEVVRVWAPRARSLDVVVGSTKHTATAEPGGWWRGPLLEPGTDYALAIDGGPPRPDPRSRWQPRGVHGPSRLVAPATLGPPVSERSGFRATPLRDAVIYELHIGTFSREGTFAGAIPHLDALVSLGATHVELMPIAAFPGHHGWGYDGVSLFAAHEPYGGPAGLRALIDACHARGLAVLIDVVHNHFGPEGAYHDQLAPYRTSTHATPWGDAINLDAEGSPEVRRFLIDSALGWLRDFGADGLRLDAVHALIDTGARHFVSELTDAVRSLEVELDRPLAVIGEYDHHDPRSVDPTAAGGWGLDAHWNDDFHHAVHVALTGETTGYYRPFATRDALPGVFERGYLLGDYGARPRDHLVAYVQSHDQVGNRAAGDRLSHQAGLARARCAAALLLTSPFVPMMFQGEEWAASTPFCFFADLESPALREAVREGRRREHAAAGWDHEPYDALDPTTRHACVLDWDEATTGDHAAMRAWYTQLIALRRSEPALRAAEAEATRAAWTSGHVVTIERGPLVVTCNLGDSPAAVADGEPIAASQSLASHREAPPLSCVVSRR